MCVKRDEIQGCERRWPCDVGKGRRGGRIGKLPVATAAALTTRAVRWSGGRRGAGGGSPSQPPHWLTPLAHTRVVFSVLYFEPVDRSLLNLWLNHDQPGPPHILLYREPLLLSLFQRYLKLALLYPCIFLLARFNVPFSYINGIRTTSLADYYHMNARYFALSYTLTTRLFIYSIICCELQMSTDSHFVLIIIDNIHCKHLNSTCNVIPLFYYFVCK